MKNTLAILIVFFTLLSLASSVSADTLRKEIRESVKETIEKGKEEGLKRGEIKAGFLDKVRSFMKRNLRFEARVRGKITVIGSNNFSLTGDDGTFQINITDKTQLLRKFGGKSSLSEYVVGNEVVVFGKFTDESKTVIEAKTVKNNSIQKRRGAFFGKVTVKNSDNLVMETKERGTQTVYFGTAKIVDRKETIINITDVKVGDRVRVRGVWDKLLNQIREVDHIKDFSIPIIVPTQSP